MRSGLSKLCLLAALVAACSGRKQAEPDPAVVSEQTAPSAKDSSPPRAVVSDELWELAPAGATAGIIVKAGVLPGLLAVSAEVTRLLAARSETRSLVARLAEWRQWSGLDLGDGAALERVGFDLAGGVAVFFDDKLAPLVVVVPGVDGHRFAEFAEPFEDGGAAFYRWPRSSLVCGNRAGHLICGRDAAAIASTAGGGTSPLASTVRRLPAPLRGDIELVADLTRIPDLSTVRRRSAIVLAEPELVVLSLRLDAGTARLRGWISGRPMPPWGTILAAPTSLAGFDALRDRAVSGLRLRIDPTRIATAFPPRELAAGVDLQRDLLAHLTGDIGLFTTGAGALAGVVALGVSDEAAVRKVVPSLCNALVRSFGTITRLDDEGCQATLELPRSLAGHQLARAIVSQLNAIPLALSVRDHVLRLEIGEIGSSGPAVPATPRPGWQLSAWTRTGDPLATMQPGADAVVGAVLAALTAEQRQQFGGLRWLLSQLAVVEVEAGFAPTGGSAPAAIVGDGLHLSVTAITFAADPGDVRAAYEAALAAELDGGAGGYRAAMAAIERDYPATHVGRLAAMVGRGAPILGPCGALIVAGLPALSRHVDQARPSRRGANRR